jgi:PGF-CTERM protein
MREWTLPGGTQSRGAAAIVTAVVVWSVLVGWTAAPTAAALDGTPAGEPTGATVDSLTVTATPRTVAAGVGDTVDVDGSTPDDFDVRLYLVGPRGTFLDADGATEAMTTGRVSSNAFSEPFTAFSRRGTYTLVAVNPGPDGSFQTDTHLGRGSLPSGLTHQQAVDLVRSEYSGDEVVELSISARTPTLGIDTVSDDGTAVYGTDLTVSGTSNRAAGTAVTVELLRGSGRPTTTAVTDVDDASGAWSADLDTADLEPGTYTVVASTDVSRASALVVVTAEGTATPAETASAAESSAEATDGDADSVAAAEETLDNVTDAALGNGTEGLEAASGSGVTGGNGSADATDGTENGTANASGNDTANGTAAGESGSTSGSLPGFGVGAVVAALVVVAVAVRRRTAD